MTVVGAFVMWVMLPEKQEPPLLAPKQEESLNQEVKQAKQDTQMVHIERSDGTKEEIALEEYLVGVVGSEMSASFELEALKAQAVAARTFVAQRNFIVDDSTASQVYQDDEQLKQVWKDQYDEYRAKINQAITDTKQEVITYQGECITAAFFSSSNGATNNSEDYWQNALPYLRSVKSPWDQKIEGATQTVSFSLDELSSILGFQNRIQSISKPERYANGYVKRVTIDGIVFTGRELRELLSLRSSAFEINIVENEATFTTHGFGHGIGMSQYGANAMAQEGKSYRDILLHYYTDVEITQLHV